MEDKQTRQEALLNLLESKGFFSQQDIVSAMQDMGFNVTQPSISRDFKELGIVKLAGKYVSADRVASQSNGQPSASSLIEGLTPAGPNLLVVRTRIGAANVVAAAIDELPVDGLVGTVAGDDTIFLATSGKAAQAAIIGKIKDIRLPS